MKPTEEPLPQETVSEKIVHRRTILSFSIFALLPVAGWKIFGWLKNAPKDAGAPKPLRAVLNTNEKLFSSVFDKDRLIKEYPVSAAARNVRLNGNLGLRDSEAIANWRLQVVRSNGNLLHVSLDDLKALPKKEIVFDFKCIEGWDQVSHWAGVPLKTFMDHYRLQEEAQQQYISLETPDKKYYVGIDMPSARHPQTLLCYEMNGQPLPPDHGFPLRLIIPVKYGIKHLKRIGTMAFSNQKPPDYWAERGYDYYAGH